MDIPVHTQVPDDVRRRIVAILSGPTASGKSALAMEIAGRRELQIISADSMQVYRGMEIGTGAVSPDDRRGIPHHLIGIVPPTEDFNAARYLSAISDLAKSEPDAYFLVVGGTGMWIEALREGLFAGPGRDDAVRERLRAEWETGRAGMWERLQKLDPDYSPRISPNDAVRVQRALEVFELTGRPLSDWFRDDEARRAKLSPLIPLVVIRHPKPELDERINRRVDEMISAGWLEEARRLAALGLAPHSPARKAIGYRELFRVIDGDLDQADAIVAIKTATRQYAKRQMSWFRSQPEVRWIDGADTGAAERAILTAQMIRLSPR